MATQYTQNTFLAQYNDDYRDSDHFHRILFNNGRALQARELTQMQTIIQAEISRIATYLFNEGSILNTNVSLASGPNEGAYTFVKVDNLSSISGSQALVGTEINDGTLYAVVKAVIPSETVTRNGVVVTDPDTLIVKMGRGNPNTGNQAPEPSSALKFQAGGTLTTDLGNLDITVGTNVVGTCTLIDTPRFESFAAGHMIMVEAQTLIIDKYSPTGSGIVGFKITEEIITSSDNVALFDNSGTTPNLTSPGADRYKITLTLDLKKNSSAGSTFFELYHISNGLFTLVKTKDNNLNFLGDLLNDRTKAISGNFIEKTGGLESFTLSIEDDSIDENYLSYSLAGGTAFIEGQKITKKYFNKLRVAKPRSLVNDVETKTNEFVSARYGGYFLADSAWGLIGKINDYTTVNLYDIEKNGTQQYQLNSFNTNIGTARVRHIDEYNDQYRIHVFDVNMVPSKGIKDVKSLGSDSDNHANLVTLLGSTDIYDIQDNNLLFNLGRDRVQTVSNLTSTVGVVKTDTSSGAGVATNINSTGSNTLTDAEQWLISVDSSGEIFSEASINIAVDGLSASISGLPFNSAITVLAYENTTLTQKVKTISSNVTETGLSLSNGRFNLNKVDIYQFISITDDTTGANIKHKFILDNGQRDNHYQAGGGDLKASVSAPAGTITVVYKYFNHGSAPSGVGYFGGKASYPSLSYDKIPSYTTATGVKNRLTDVIDMRPIKDPSSGSFTSGDGRIERLPRNTDTLTVGTTEYWKPRVDIISLAPDGIVHHHAGPSSFRLLEPSDIQPTHMLLHKVTLGPYTLNAKDLRKTSYDNRGFKMADIRKMDRRLNNVEALTTLSQTEWSLSQLEVYDPDNPTSVRQTEGLSGDGFNNLRQTDYHNNDHRALVYDLPGIMAPLQYKRQVGVTFDLSSSDDVTLKGDQVWPVYTEVVADWSMDSATSYIAVNQFETGRTIGVGELTPQMDYWTVKKKVDESYISEAEESFIDPDGNPTILSQPLGFTDLDAGEAYNTPGGQS
jgi:hypothetical protein